MSVMSRSDEESKNVIIEGMDKFSVTNYSGVKRKKKYCSLPPITGASKDV